MRIEQLYYMVEIAQSKSMTLAAERLHVTQPSISLAISNLEKELGVALFERSRLGVYPTETGERVVKRAREILIKIEELKLEANKNSSALTGNLSLAVVPSICLTLLPRTLTIFKKKHSNVNITIKEEGSIKVIQDLQESRADLGLIAISDHTLKNDKMREVFEKQEIYFERLFFDELVACVGKLSPLSISDSISLKEIVKHPIVIFNPEYSMHYGVTKMLSNYGQPNIMFTSGNTEITKKVISEGTAIGFTTNLSLRVDRYVQSGEIIPLRIVDNPVSVEYGWVRLTHHHFQMAGQEFINILKSQCQNFIG